MTRASIVVDIRHIRCGNCKVALHDELATVCPVCGSLFDSISSNHVSLAARLERRRRAAGVSPTGGRVDLAAETSAELIAS